MEQASGQPSSGRTNSATCVWVLAASPLLALPSSLDWLPQPNRVVAADGGSSLAARLGLTPDLVVGDLDSSDPELVEQLQGQGVLAERHQHRTKLETDTELAALAALRWDPVSIIILGGTGGRIDHSLANVLLLSHPALAEHDVRIIEGRQEVLLAKVGRWNDLPASPGDTVSLLPLGEVARGIATENLEYPLNTEDLLPGSGRGVSNVVTRRHPRVWLDEGLLLIIVVHAG